MLKQAAVVFAGVLVATSAALWFTPTPQTRAASTPPARAAAPAAPAPKPVTPPVSVEEPGLRGAHAAAIAKSDDGHFWAEAQANGARVRFLVDTGATTVALTADDARRLGLEVATLAYTLPVRTASGEAKAAPVKLDYVSISGARIENVDALVVRDGLPASLLGMSYLGRLSSFEATPEGLILRP